MNSYDYVQPLAEDDICFGPVQLAEADLQGQRDPGGLSDRQLQIIATYDQPLAQSYAQKRVVARMKAAAPPVAPSSPTQPGVRYAELARCTKADDLDADGAWDRWYAKNGTKATPVWMTKEVVDFVRRVNEKRSDLEDRVRRLESLVVLQDNKIKNIEGNTTTRGAQWGGEYVPGTTYKAGELVGYRNGGVWVALKDCASAPGSHLGDWDVFVPASTSKP